MFPNVINSCIEASVSLGRVHKFLVSEEINTNGIVHTLTKSPINEGAWGTIKVTDGAFAAWIQNATVRDNILFGQSFDRTKYDNIVSACALRDDFDVCNNRDEMSM
ncbi:hypothetical protein SARC_05055 [Sphaeroforma arctica JP610]|uniref:Uncharacterized protein n=1 Tax=Sphaeroforma arctica JP610 TaxID=667725 RepID=A0A0L0G0R9_9EUKA|nr:hypothetical protein SARC_05055 [Sphaeroforma arctica JP610]KNC82655.1 hypothetical protein SARC_05055 [Sphaeroforma arctica JP610]|eukprot:XP_014156557.1 hypothetical protein SARC_05055 [Sphaeroforma arctica JP610]